MEGCTRSTCMHVVRVVWYSWIYRLRSFDARVNAFIRNGTATSKTRLNENIPFLRCCCLNVYRSTRNAYHAMRTTIVVGSLPYRPSNRRRLSIKKLNSSVILFVPPFASPNYKVLVRVECKLVARLRISETTDVV